MRAASTLDFSIVQRFKYSDWPATALEQMSADVILSLALVRDRLPATHKMYPSPLLGAHVRSSGASQHSTNGGAKLSCATDCFMESWRHLLDFLIEAQRCEEIGGIGLYTNKWRGTKGNITPMFHIDTRDARVLWICCDTANGEEYIYFHRDPVRYFAELTKIATKA